MDADSEVQNEIINVESAAVDTQPSGGANSTETGTQSVKIKRPIKLTQKAFMDKLETLQKTRKSKLNKASNLKVTIRELMQDRDFETEVHCSFDKYKILCNEAKETHESLLKLLPATEKDKHDIWFKAKVLSVNDFIDDVNKWLEKTDIPKPGGNEDRDESEVKPSDSISNIETNVSGKKSSLKSYGSSRSGKSSTASARIQAEAERAALEARAAALKEKHTLEEQTEELRRRREKLELHTEMAATAAKLAVLSSPSLRALSNTQSNGMQSYFEKGEKIKETATTLNPKAKEYQHTCMDSQFQPFTKQHATQECYNNQDVQLREMATHGKVISDPQFTNSNVIQSQIPLQGTDETSELYNLLQRQNEISAMLIQQQASHLLPPREIPFFDGDPLQYKTFIRAFEHCVENNASNKGDCLYFLDKYTRGQPKELVRSCQHMAPDRGYTTAKQLLEEHFGNEHKITAAYMEKVENWSVIKHEDVKSLQGYALFLRECCNAMVDVQYMRGLDMPANMKTVIMKLPYKLREKWRVTACEILEKLHRRAQFADIVSFIERQVRILTFKIQHCCQDSFQNDPNIRREYKTTPLFQDPYLEKYFLFGQNFMHKKTFTVLCYRTVQLQ